jgi:ABC-type xylose transport system permease subunit
MRTGARIGLRWIARIAPLPPAAFAVHQLRYLLAYGSSAGVELQRTGHSYLHSVVPWIVLCLAVVAGGFLWALGRALAAQATIPRYGVSLAGMWAVCSVCLIAIFATQELLEGVLATGHPAGLAGVFGYGGWWSIPAAACVGLVLAVWFHGARWVLREVARRARRERARIVTPPVRGLHEVLLAPAAPLCAGWSGRGPPQRR